MNYCMWKILSTKTIFKHPRIELLEDRVQLSNGTKIEYLRFAKGNDCVSVIVQREDGSVLLQREYSHPIGDVIWQLPGGMLSKDESPKRGADRELQEECKMQGVDYEVIGKYLLNNRRSENFMYVVVSRGVKKVIGLPADTEEDIESFWKTSVEIDEMIKKGEIINCHLLASWSIYRLR